MKKIMIIFENKPRRKKPRRQNKLTLKKILGAFVFLLEVILMSGVWHSDQNKSLQLILITMLIAIFTWVLMLFSNHL